MSEDDRLRYEQESRDKFLFDQHWDRIYKFEEGLEKGIEKGKEEIVLRMLGKNLDFSFISEITGVSEKEIKKIQKK